MNKSMPIIGLTFFLFSCGNSDREVKLTEEIVITEPTDCHCDDLLQDLKKNVFYLNTPEKPFSGQCHKYHNDKSKKIERTYINGRINGKIIEWYANGRKKLEQEFSKNLAQGISNQWNEEGVLTYSAQYNNGKLDSILVNLPKLVAPSDGF